MVYQIPEVKSIIKGEELTKNSSYDCLVLVTDDVSSNGLEGIPVKDSILKAMTVDKTVGKVVAFILDEGVCGGRLVVSPTGTLDGDGDDVRRYGDAAAAGVRRAIAAGSRRPALAVMPGKVTYARAVQVALLGALAEGYDMLQAREADGYQPALDGIGFTTMGLGQSAANADEMVRQVVAIEEGRAVSRDIGCADPERMAPRRALEYIEKAFEGTDVKVEAVEDEAELRKSYPCAMAVARASLAVERHRPVVVRLTYTGAKPEETLCMAGKGIVYDTGGADIKAGGIMAGMSRDKGGAASLAGFMRTVASLRPPHLAVRMELGFVRNSVGADSYVADEIIRSAGGARVQVGNTDAEGRMVLCDLLTHLRRWADALPAVKPHFFACATLTGHAPRAVGPYSIALDNRAAANIRSARCLQDAADLWGDPFEVSTLRREDFEIIRSRSAAMDVLQCNNAASSVTPRGHQFPAAFLLRASGLHNSNLPYTHMDIAGSFADNYQFGKGSGSPVTALTARYILRDE